MLGLFQDLMAVKQFKSNIFNKSILNLIDINRAVFPFQNKTNLDRDKDRNNIDNQRKTEHGVGKADYSILKQLTGQQSLLLYNARRFMSSRPDCFQDKLPRQLQTPCEKASKPQPSVSMWQNTSACKDPPDFTPRYDALYWKASDMRKKTFAQTWTECPKLKMVEKEICCYEHYDLSPPEKRDSNYFTKKISACVNITKRPCPGEKCPKLKAPCTPCHALGCQKPLKKAKCQKYCAPLPSYTETKMFKAKIPKTECTCLSREAMCNQV